MRPPLPFYDAHCHSAPSEQGVIAVQNLRPDTNVGAPLPANTYVSTGIHPWWLAEFSGLDLDQLFGGWRSHPQFVALGELGLDASIATPRAQQIAVCLAQLTWAKAHGIPCVIVHCVRLHNEFMRLIKLSGYQGTLVFHDYNGSPQLTTTLLQRQGVYFSFGQRLFAPRSRGYQSFLQLPAERVLLETDDAKASKNPHTISEVYAQAEALRPLTPPHSWLSVVAQNFQRAFGRS